MSVLTFIVTGAATSVTFPTYLLQLRERLKSLTFRLVVTKSAEQFLPLGSLRDLADELELDSKGYNPLEIVEGTDWTFVLPATMNVVVASSLGLGATPSQSALAGLGRRVTYFPSMPHQYWDAPITQRAVSELRSQGRSVIDPVLASTYEFYNKSFQDFYRVEDPQIVCALVESTCVREKLL